MDSLVKHPLNKSTSADEISYRTSSFISDTSKSETDSIFLSKWAEIEVIDLINDGPGLGFGIIGGKSIGVIVKTILHNGVAYRDNRLKSGDFILQVRIIHFFLTVENHHHTVLVTKITHFRKPILNFLSWPRSANY